MKRRISHRLLQDLLRQGRSARFAGRDAEARVHYAEALEAARSARDWSMESDALAGQGNTEVWTDPALARDLLTSALALTGKRGQPVRIAALRQHLALACLDAGDAAEARRLLELSLPLLEKQHQDFAVAFGSEVLALVLVTEGRGPEALQQLRKAVALRRQPGGEEASPLRWRNRRDAVLAELLTEAG